MVLVVGRGYSRLELSSRTHAVPQPQLAACHLMWWVQELWLSRQLLAGQAKRTRQQARRSCRLPP